MARYGDVDVSIGSNYVAEVRIERGPNNFFNQP